MSSVLRIPASAFEFFPAPEIQVEEAAVEPSSEEVELRVRRELQAECDQRIVREIAQREEALKAQYETLFSQYSSQLSAGIDSLRTEIQNKVVDLSIQLAEVIVRHELPDRSMLEGLITKTLEPVSDLQGVSVHVSSEDHALLGGEFISDVNGIQHALEFVCDPQLKSGDVIVESRNGIFDARLDERLKMLKETLHERSGRKDDSAPEA